MSRGRVIPGTVAITTSPTGATPSAQPTADWIRCRASSSDVDLLWHRGHGWHPRLARDSPGQYRGSASQPVLNGQSHCPQSLLPHLLQGSGYPCFPNSHFVVLAAFDVFIWLMRDCNCICINKQINGATTTLVQMLVPTMP